MEEKIRMSKRPGLIRQIQNIRLMKQAYRQYERLFKANNVNCDKFGRLYTVFTISDVTKLTSKSMAGDMLRDKAFELRKLIYTANLVDIVVSDIYQEIPNEDPNDVSLNILIIFTPDLSKILRKRTILDENENAFVIDQFRYGKFIGMGIGLLSILTTGILAILL